MNRLLVTAMMVVCLALGFGGPAPAQTAVEYGGLASQNGVGGATNHKFGSVRTRQKTAKQSKARR